MLEGSAQSYWMASSKSPEYPTLTEDVDVDVAVIGGGIAGISTAWELTRAGRPAIVLEADRIVSGVTGFTTGRLSALHPWVFAPLRDSLGAEAARLYARSQQEAVEHAVQIADKLGIQCDVERRPSYLYVEPVERTGDLKAEAAAVREAGLAASFVTETPLPYDVAGAVKLDEQVQFHPRHYLLGLAEDLVRGGGRIYEQTRVVDLVQGRRHRLTTDAGVTVHAREVVIATLFPVFGRALLDFRLVPLRELVIAAPIAEEDDPGAMFITREDNTRSVRTAPYGEGQRLLLITGESFEPGSGETTERHRTLVEWTRRHFKIGDVHYWWAAQDLDTTDKLPYVGRVDDNLYVATGYARSGMSHGIMSGRLLAGLLTGEEQPWTDLYAPRRKHPIREAGPVLKVGLSHLRRRIADQVRVTRMPVAELKPGTGAVVRMRGRVCAIYRDDHGTPHVLSARCPHSGCLVTFNDAERVWECPCHGCRFAADGSVLQGPATAPLSPEYECMNP
ncbi:glycine/D-amino acid oxidase-like deaminating enzyme/nitrite reductase/ring-hydroxylating ferredoxin subunit [Actinomadura coerulea]|uniref:Glycine/D-amino acid oxidase-like deaminating enzyme/nitrite reductase/ring-hydroxylating ferredoxin subunit n=1 Tax=Actinomadura coerulea TaxID=46159 RepID=A0A7X0G4Z8_9ACTN|nr:FAD-dependent oxidoreductase [Actinomadura coerulea]MBB6399501.1 glycine/D-amino acid oxidase-like deaminating enzyme/nitrite reductase/ring-hydroxylating ferredoxin subunit [Actinomadura coerulea]GGQ13292.1 iron-sulfur-binding protein [Actinomadura coerulea]